VKPGVEPSALVASWGKLNADTLPLSQIARNRKTASELVDKVGFDSGPAS
jgi:iron(III) transport system substrate-binding protein